MKSLREGLCIKSLREGLSRREKMATPGPTGPPTYAHPNDRTIVIAIVVTITPITSIAITPKIRPPQPPVPSPGRGADEP